MTSKCSNRLGRGGCVVIALALGTQVASGGVAPSAYFSLEGDINAIGDQYDFTFDLTRSVGSGEDLRFRTYTHQGGTNAAGDTITANFFDSDLRLFDSLNALRGQDDESGPDFDALLSWAVVQSFDTPLNPDPLPADSYRLNIQEYQPDGAAIGPFAVDLIGPDDALVFTGGSPVNGGTVDSLKFGSNNGGTAVYNHAGASGTFTLLGELVIAQTGNAELNLSGGTITAGGLTTVNSGGSISQTGGTFNADGGLTVDGGSYTRDSGDLNLASGTALTVQNGGLLRWDNTSLILNDTGSSVEITGIGSTLRNDDSGSRTMSIRNAVPVDVMLGGTIIGNYLAVGDTGTDGHLTVDGAGSSLNFTTGTQGGFSHFIGFSSGSNGVLTLSNNASATLTDTLGTELRIGANGSTGTLNVLTDADMTIDGLDMDESGTSTVTVNGAGSTITQTADSALTVGSASGSVGTLNVENSGVFTASHTGTLNVNATGVLNVDSGTFNADGAAVGDIGGTLNTSGTVNVTGAGLISLNGKGVADKYDPGMGGVGGTINATGGTIDLSGTGRIRANGGRSGDDNQIGPVGGTFTITGGAAVNAVDTSQIQLIGGQGGADPPFNNSGRTGGVGGTMNVTNGNLTLGDSSKLNLDGGLGGEVSAIGNDVDGTGGMGGTLNINGGSVSVNNTATVSLGGGNSPNSFFGDSGNGGAGGQLLVSAGSMTVNGGLVTLDGGAGFGSGTNGAHGTTDVTGGTFEMNGGEVFTGTFQRSGTGVFNHNDGKLTVSGGSFDTGSIDHTINGPSAAELPTLVLTDGATAPGVTGNFTVGDANRGRFELLNGSTLNSAEVDLGNFVGGLGQALVDGAGSAWTSSGANAFVVGEAGTGELTVINGGSVSTSDFFVVGRGSTSNGTVHIGSGGSVDATNSSNQMVIGESGTGVVNVNAGGSVSSATHVRIATFGSGNGTLNVNGSGSVVTANASLNVGGWEGGAGGTGKLTVNQPAVVKLNGGNLRNYAGGTIETGFFGTIDAIPAPAGPGVAGTNGKTLTTSGVITNTDGSILFDGGDGGGVSTFFATGGAGGTGGTLNANGGTITNLVDGVLSFNGGNGGTNNCCDNYGGDGGAGGTLNLTNTTVTLNSFSLLRANGGDGGSGDTFGDGAGGAGGTINLNSGFINQFEDSQVLLTGGDAGTGQFGPGNVGGDGGSLNLLGGTYTLNDNATIDLRGGQGTNGNAGGAHGIIDLQSGAFSMFGGEVFAGTFNHPGTGVFDFDGGTLHVETFNGTLDQQDGTLAPGFSAGKTVINGGYGLTAGTLEIELGGTTAGVDFDQVEVLGFAQLFGDLDVSLINGFVPTYGDSFLFLLAWGGVNDNFSSVSLPAVPIPNAAWNLFNDGGVLFLNLNSTLAGDLNNDGFVGIADLNIVLGNWNQTIPPGDPLADPSGDNFVGIADLNIVLGNWNAGTPPPPGVYASIPEPGTGVLAGLAGWALLRRRHGR